MIDGNNNKPCAHCGRLPGDPEYCDWQECPAGHPSFRARPASLLRSATKAPQLTTKLPELLVTLNGVPVADQAAGRRAFAAACLKTNHTPLDWLKAAATRAEDYAHSCDATLTQARIAMHRAEAEMLRARREWDAAIKALAEAERKANE